MNLNLDIHCLQNCGDLVLRRETDSFKEMTSQELIQLTSNHFEEFIRAFEQSKMLKTPQSSHAYSLQIQEAERQIEVLKKIDQILEEKQVNHDVDVASLEVKLKEMRDNLPVGPSVLLLSDIQRLERWSQVPREECYQNPLGTFYNPKVSEQDLYTWFREFEKQGGYHAVNCMYKIHRLGKRDFGKMLTCFTLVRTEIQREGGSFSLSSYPRLQWLATKGANGYSAIKNGVSSRWQMFKERYYSTLPDETKPVDEDEEEIVSSDEASWVEMEVAQNPSLIVSRTPLHHSNESLEVVSLSMLKNIGDYQERQRRVVQHLAEELPKMIEEWGFKSCLILSPEEQMETLGFSKSTASLGDRILLFHRRKDE